MAYLHHRKTKGITLIRDLDEIENMRNNYVPYETQPNSDVYNQPVHQLDDEQEHIKSGIINHTSIPSSYMNMKCIDISQHLKHCPVCSRLYLCNKTATNVAIVILAIIVVLLLKRVLENH